MKTLNQYITEKLLDHKSNPTASQSLLTEKLKISKSNNISIDVDVDPKVEQVVKKIVSEMPSNKGVEFFYDKVESTSTPGLRFFKWSEYYDMTTNKDHRDLDHDDMIKYYKENGQIIVTDEDNKRIAGLMFVQTLNCEFLDKLKEDTYLVILKSDPIILNKEAYEEVVLRAIEENELNEVKSLFRRSITFEGHTIKNTSVVPYEFLKKILNN